MASTAKLYAVAKLHHAHFVAVLFAEESDCTHFLGIGDVHVAVVLEGHIFANAAVDQTLHLANFFGSDLLEVGEVETETLRRDERSLLLNVRAEHFAEGLVDEVRRGVVGFAGTALIDIDAGHEFGLGMSGQLLSEVDGEVVFALGVEDFNRFLLVDQYALVAYLSAHFCIERRVVKHQFKVGLLLLLHLAIFQNAAAVFGEIPTVEGGVAFGQHHPVTRFGSGSVAGAFLLLLHFGIESGFIDL